MHGRDRAELCCEPWRGRQTLGREESKGMRDKDVEGDREGGIKARLENIQGGSKRIKFGREWDGGGHMMFREGWGRTERQGLFTHALSQMERACGFEAIPY